MIRNDLAALQAIADQVAAHFKRPSVTVEYHRCPAYDDPVLGLRLVLMGGAPCDRALYGVTRTNMSDPTRPLLSSVIRINPDRGGIEDDEMVLLHELGHHVVPQAGHSERFYRTLVDILKFRGRDPREYPWQNDPLGLPFALTRGYVTPGDLMLED